MEIFVGENNKNYNGIELEREGYRHKLYSAWNVSLGDYEYLIVFKDVIVYRNSTEEYANEAFDGIVSFDKYSTKLWDLNNL